MPAFLFGPPTKPNPDVRRAGRRVLIVEDEAMIAGLIETILSAAGWSVVGAVATLERALETIELERLDAALLDVRINGHDAFALADVLMRRHILFIFVSGFTRKQMPPRYPQLRVYRQAVHAGCDLGAVGGGRGAQEPLAEPARGGRQRGSCCDGNRARPPCPGDPAYCTGRRDGCGTARPDRPHGRTRPRHQAGGSRAADDAD